MSENVKETKCSTCEHRNVCMYKANYIELVESLSLVYSDAENSKSVFKFVNPDCIHYKPTISIIR